MAGIWITKRVAKILSSSSDRCHQSFLWFSKNMNFADFGGTQKHGWLWTSSQRLLGTTTKAYGQTVAGKGLQLTWCLDSSGRLLTIFSASRYAGRFSNSGGVAVLHHGTGPTEASLSLRFLGRDWTWWVQMTSFFRTMPLVSKKKKFFFLPFSYNSTSNILSRANKSIESCRKMRFDSGLQLHCVEHDLPQSHSHVAQSAARGLARFDAGAEQESRWSAVVAFKVEGFQNPVANCAWHAALNTDLL